VNSTNIHHWTDLRHEINVTELCESSKDFREYVVTEHDNRPGKRHRKTREQRFPCTCYFDMEISIDPNHPIIILYRAPRPGAHRLDCVAYGRWDGERIQVHVWKPLKGAAPLQAHKYLPILATTIHTELQP